MTRADRWPTSRSVSRTREPGRVALEGLLNAIIDDRSAGTGRPLLSRLVRRDQSETRERMTPSRTPGAPLATTSARWRSLCETVGPVLTGGGALRGTSTRVELEKQRGATNILRVDHLWTALREDPNGWARQADQTSTPELRIGTCLTGVRTFFMAPRVSTASSVAPASVSESPSR